MAFCMQRAGKLNQYEASLKGASSDVMQNIDLLAGRVARKTIKSEHSLHAVHPARFQVLDVDNNVPIKEFVQDGYLHEVNRQFLHPLGLALEATRDEKGEYTLTGIWDNREDPEGMLLDLVNNNKAKKILAIQKQRTKYREEHLGYNIQPLDT